VTDLNQPKEKLMSLEFSIPTRISYGVGALEQLSPSPGSLLVVVSSSLPHALVDGLIDRLIATGSEVQKLLKPPGEPNSAVIDDAFDSLLSVPDAIVGIGGGAVLDFAKALALLAGNGGKIADYEFGQRKIDSILPLFLAPTTCGSGSEVTPYAVINNSDTKRKFTVTHPRLRPKHAAIDPTLLRSLPPVDRLATALDAFIHCLEAHLTRSDSRLIAPLSEAGLALGWRLLPHAADKNPSNEVLDGLAQMSLYGGLCIAHSRTGLIHTLSVAFAMFCDLPHGLLNTYLLPYALAHNLPGYNGLLAQIISRCSGQTLEGDSQALEILVKWLNCLIVIHPPTSPVDILSRQHELVSRILQDGGLANVSHGDINENSLTTLIRNIADAKR